MEIGRIMGEYLKRPRVDRIADACVVGLAVLFACGIRYLGRDFVSRDFLKYTSIWYAAIQSQGFAAVGTGVSNYTPPYLYLLYGVSRAMPALQPVFAVKIPSIVCDFVCAWFVYLIVRLRYPAGRAPMFAFIAVLLAPTVTANSSLWGQADSLYSAMLLACIYLLMRGRGAAAFLAFGLALSLKLQAIFLAPALGAFWLRRAAPIWAVLLVPVVYLIAMLPAAIAGRPWLKLLAIYLHQSESYEGLNKNAPNLYAWAPQGAHPMLLVAGIVLAAGMAGYLVWKVWRSAARLEPDSILRLSLLSLLVMPFFLPKMHERYFYPADVVSIAYGFYFPRQYFVPVLVSFASFFSYTGYLFDDLQSDASVKMLSLVMLAALISVARPAARALDGASG
jgi:Gpi18-like mannosyltransferase